MQVGEIQLDLDNLTLGEMELVERASGRSFDSLLSAGRATRKILAVFLHESRSYDWPLSPQEQWQLAKSRRLSDALFSDSPSLPAGPLVTSPD